MSSNNKTKKVHYESGTKPGASHRHRSSRDSGVGSSSASDQASIGTSPNESPFASREAKRQQYDLKAVHEALKAANEKIQQLHIANEELSKSLAESNRENRLLKQEKRDLHDKVSNLEEEVKEEKEMNKRLLRKASPPPSSTTSSGHRSSGSERKKTPPLLYQERLPVTHAGRYSVPPSPAYERPMNMPTVPQPPPNPFTPLSERPPTVTYASTGAVKYAPSTVSYSPQPLYASSHSSRGSRDQRGSFDDGKYHLKPL